MGLINTTGYFRGTIVDGGLGQSTGGFPQEVLALKATEVYDAENQEYVSVDDEHDEITAYLILISSKDKETKSAQQLKKIIGWDGASFVDLHGMDLADVPLSFRVEENTYEGNTTLQVQWIAEPDATPGRTVQKITKEDAAALQARYAPVLASTKTPTKAVSAKAKRKEKTTAKSSRPGELAAANAKLAKADKTPAKPKPPIAPKPAVVVGECTDQEAYDEVYALSGATEGSDIEKDLNERWQNIVATYGPDELKITPEQWFDIKELLSKTFSQV